MHVKKLLGNLLMIGLASIPAISDANDSLELEDLRNLVQKLEQKVKVLERKNELADENVVAAKKSSAIPKAGNTGFAIESADAQNTIKFRGLIQTDYRAFDNGENDVRGRSNDRAGTLNNSGFHDANDTALIRRARPIIEGSLNGKYDFRFVPEFGGGTVTIFDAFVDAKLNTAFKIRAGKYRPFVGLERLQSASDLKFIERSYVTNAILPNRDVGLSVFGDLVANKLTYAIGLNNGVSDGGNASGAPAFNNSKELTVRLFATPFTDEVSAWSGLSFGIAGTFANIDGERNLDFTNSSAADTTRNGLPNGYLTEGQQVFFRYGSTTVAHGNRTRLAPQASYYYGPFGLLAEYVQEHQEVGLLNSAASNAPSSLVSGSTRTLTHSAWDIGLTYLLTQEDASFKGVKPLQDFDLSKGTWGAWELTFRVSEINLDKNTFKNAAGQYAAEGGTTLTSAYADLSRSASAAHTWTAGVNWYLNQNTRLQLNYLQTAFNGGAIAGGGATGSANASGTNVRDRPDEKAILGRLQVSF